MVQKKVKSSIYLSPALHEQVKKYGGETSLSLNTLVVLALQEYLGREDRQKLLKTCATEQKI